MDITSPFFVVPVMAVIFLSCILYATIGDKEASHEPVADESNSHHGTH